MGIKLTGLLRAIAALGWTCEGFAADHACDLGPHSPPTKEDAVWVATLKPPPEEPDCPTKQKIQAALDAQVPGGHDYLVIGRYGEDWIVSTMPYENRPKPVLNVEGIMFVPARASFHGTTYVLDQHGLTIKSRFTGQ
jgi:hypothetical protein